MVAFVVLCWLVVGSAVILPELAPPPRQEFLTPSPDPRIPTIPWQKHRFDWVYAFDDGAMFLVAVRALSPKTGLYEWVVDLVRVRLVRGEPVLVDPESGRPYTAWAWADFEYFAPINGVVPQGMERYPDTQTPQ